MCLEPLFVNFFAYVSEIFKTEFLISTSVLLGFNNFIYSDESAFNFIFCVIVSAIVFPSVGTTESSLILLSPCLKIILIENWFFPFVFIPNVTFEAVLFTSFEKLFLSLPNFSAVFGLKTSKSYLLFPSSSLPKT